MVRKPDSNEQKNKRGTVVVRELLESSEGGSWKVSKATGRGYDLLATKPGHSMTIEVKTTADDKGIPDCFSSEFDDEKKLVADYLYVVRVTRRLKLRRVDILAKEEVDKYRAKHRIVGRVVIASRLVNDLRDGLIGRVVRLQPRESQTKSLRYK